MYRFVSITDPSTNNLTEITALVEQREAHVLVLLLLDLLLRGRGGTTGGGGTSGATSDGNASSDTLELLASGGNHLLDVLALELLDQDGGTLGVGVNSNCRGHGGGE